MKMDGRGSRYAARCGRGTERLAMQEGCPPGACWSTRLDSELKAQAAELCYQGAHTKLGQQLPGHCSDTLEIVIQRAAAD